MEAGTPELVKLEDLQVGSGLTGRKHVLSLLVENKPGVLARIAGLFSRRGFNIDTLAVGPTEDPDVSRITLTVDGAVHPIDQVTKQLHKLVNVIKIRDMDRQIKDLEGKLASLAPAQEERTEVKVFVNAGGALDADITIRYHVGAASWVPFYDARLTSGRTGECWTVLPNRENAPHEFPDFGLQLTGGVQLPWDGLRGGGE